MIPLKYTLCGTVDLVIILIVVNYTFMWQCRLSLINETRLNKLHKDGLLELSYYESYQTFEYCFMGKMIKSLFSGKWERVVGLLELVHTDVCEPMITHTRGVYMYFNTFIDDHSRIIYVYLMKYKSESFKKFKKFRSEVEKQIDKSINFFD